MKTWTERLPGIIALIESDNGLDKAKAKKELEDIIELADIFRDGYIKIHKMFLEKIK